MKKLMLIAALLFASYGVFADEFDDFVAGARNGGVGDVRAVKEYKLVFFDYKLPGNTNVSEEKLAEAKKFLLAELKKNPQFAPFIRNSGITIIYNYINEERKVFSIVITPGDM